MMATFYASQTGGATGAGTLEDPWSVADMNSETWNLKGYTEGAADTTYLLGTITTALTPSFGAGGAAGAVSVIRGDYPGQECTMSGMATALNSARPYIRYQSITIENCTSSGITATGTSDYQEVTLCTFNNNNTGVLMNGSDFTSVYQNTFNNGVDSLYAVRGTNGANDFDVYDNTINGYIPDDALDDGNSTENTNEGVRLDGLTNANGKVRRNRINHVWGDAIMIRTGQSSFVDFEFNVIGPRVKTAISIENAGNCKICNNTLMVNGMFQDFDPVFKLGDDFGAGTGADNNTIQNNYIIGNDEFIFGGNRQGANNTIDYNHYYRADGDSHHINWDQTGGGVAQYSFTTFNSTFGYEANGRYATPVLETDIADIASTSTKPPQAQTTDADRVNDGLNYKPKNSCPSLMQGVKHWTGANPESFSGEPVSDYDVDVGGIQTTYSPFHPVKL